jgi:mannose-6-phosphate isomerase-like protein (cupin superfamily)
MWSTRCRTRIAAGFSFVLACFCQGDVSGFRHYPSQKLNDDEKTLAAKVGSGRVSFIPLDDFGTSRTYLVHRADSGDAELHDNMGDYFVVRSGRATLIIGGELRERRAAGPGEWASPSISGGEKTSVGPGGMVHIPAKVPHQLLIERGSKFTYVIIKVKE